MRKYNRILADVSSKVAFCSFHRALFSIVLITLLFCSSVFADNLSYLLSTEFASKNDVKDKLITPAVDNLRLAAEKDEGLASWLDLLVLTTPLVSDKGPNAYATLENGYPAVLIDIEFLLQCFGLSDLAGVSQSYPSSDAMFQIGQQYGSALAYALNNRKQIPIFRVDIDNAPLNAAQKVMAKQMSHLTVGAGVQWVILHEIGHHQLHHFSRNPNTLEESREWELAADNWAIEKMLYLGYGLYPLEKLMEAFYVQEEIQRSTGLIPNEIDSDHPSWATRLSNLKRYNTRKPSEFGKWIDVIEISSELTSGKFYANEIFVPRQPMPGVLGQFRQFGKIVQMPVEHFSDGSIRMYGRSPLELSEVTISNLGSIFPDIYFKYTDLRTGEVSTSSTRGYQADMAYNFSSSVKGFDNIVVKDVMTLDPIDLFVSFLSTVEFRPEIQRQAIAIQSALLQKQNDYLLEYAKGNIELTDAMQMTKINATQKSEEMRILLGDTKFRKMRENMLSNSFISNALEKFAQQ